MQDTSEDWNENEYPRLKENSMPEEKNIWLKCEELERENDELKVELKRAYETITRMENDVQNRNPKREMQLEEELARLQNQYEKEQEEMKEFEQMVEMFENKMAALKSENTELHEKLQAMLFSMKFVFDEWKGNLCVNARGEAYQVLKRQIEHERTKVISLEEDLHKQHEHFQNMLESEKSQAAHLAQRLLEAESERELRRREQERLERKMIQLQQELQVTRYQDKDDSQDSNTHQTSELHNQVFALESVVKYHDHLSNLKCLNSWKFKTLLQNLLQEKIWRDSQQKVKRWLSKVLSMWCREACFHRKKESGNLERELETLQASLDEEAMRSSFLSESVKRLQGKETRLITKLDALTRERDSLLAAATRDRLGSEALAQARTLTEQLLQEVGSISLELDDVSLQLSITTEEMDSWTCQIQSRMTTQLDRDFLEKRLEDLETRRHSGDNSNASNSLKIVSHKLESAEHENMNLKRQLLKANALLSSMQRLVDSLDLASERRENFEKLLDESFNNVNPIEKCMWVVKFLQNHMKHPCSHPDVSHAREEIQLWKDKVSSLQRQHESETLTRMAALDSLTSSLTTLRSEKDFLQNLVDGVDMQSSLEKLLLSFETHLTSLLSKYSRKQFEYSKLERHVDSLTNMLTSQVSDGFDQSSGSKENCAKLVQESCESHSDLMRLTEVNQSFDIQLRSWKHFAKHLAGQMFSLNVIAESSQTGKDALKEKIKEKDDKITGLNLQVQELISKLATCDSEKLQLLDQISQMSTSKDLEPKDAEEDLSNKLQVLNFEFSLERRKLASMYEKSSREYQNVKLQNDALNELVHKLKEEKERNSIEFERKVEELKKFRISSAQALQGVIKEIVLCLQDVGNAANGLKKQEHFEFEQQKLLQAYADTLDGHIGKSSTYLSMILPDLQSLKAENLQIKSEKEMKINDTNRWNLQIKEYLENFELFATNVHAKISDAKDLYLKQCAKNSHFLSVIEKQTLEIEKLSREKEQGKSIILNLQEELDESRQGSDSICSKLETVQAELESTKAQLDMEAARVKKLFESSQKSEEELQKQTEKMKAEKQVLAEEIAGLTSKLQSANQELATKKSLLQESSENLSRMNEDCKALQDDLDLSRLEISRLQSSVREEKTQNMQLTSQVEKLLIDAARNDEALMEAKEKRSMLEEDCKQLKQQLDAMAKTVTEANDTLGQRLECADVRSKKLEKENLYLKDRIKNIRNELDNSQSQKSKIQADLEASRNLFFDATVQQCHMLEATRLRDHTVQFLELRVTEASSAMSRMKDEWNAMHRLLKDKDALAEDLHRLAEEEHEELLSLEVSLDGTLDSLALSLAACTRQQAHLAWNRLRAGALGCSAWQGVSEIKEEVQEICSEYSHLVNEKLLLEVERSETTQKLAELKRVVTSLEQEKQKTSEALNACLMQVMEWKKAYDILYAEKERIKLSCMDIESQLQDEKEEKLERQEMCLQLEKECRALREEVEFNHGELMQLKSELESKNYDLDRCEQNLKDYQKSLHESETQNDRLRSLELEMLQTVKGANQLLIDETSIINESKIAVHTLKQEISEYENYQAFVLKKLVEEKKSLHAQLVQSELDMKEKRYIIQDQLQKIQGLKSRNSESNEELSILYKRVEDYDALLLAKGNELAKLHGKIAEANALSTNASERLQSSKMLEEKLRRDMKAKELQVQALQDELDALKTNLGNSTVKSNSVEVKGAFNSKLAEALEENATLTETVNMQQQVIREMRENIHYNKQLQEIERSEGNGEKTSSHVNSFDQNPEYTEVEMSQAPQADGRGRQHQVALLSHLVEEIKSLVGEAARIRVSETSLTRLSLKPTCEEEILERQASCVRFFEKRMRSERLRFVMYSLCSHHKDAKSMKVGVQRFLMRVQAMKSMREKFESEIRLRVGEVEEERERSKIEQLELQKQIVEKTDMLLTAEKKCAQLIAWVNKYKPLIETK
ncbi:hypothetical protein GUITHDRAFT_99110 [Guillardia theta CCMP2712]|uniref:Uncharacterized protein n=1 Tax=Guillardia theta (strain CCMP2712) TaxID=905079 RepID=L1K3G0_GUITC|nr:hypothetical protein GUITHDRAFT_99110 [Guillardia theta CCMP2712]EKX55331.1 hypothetical protein GUITHDRAFT_99110 [Guillardia theta CCMP2712]|eukprot:XP_005842311.1 hypothetical protein GUITHDRAFT_99110 [Guillardia theta CCMP2712]